MQNAAALPSSTDSLPAVPVLGTLKDPGSLAPPLLLGSEAAASPPCRQAHTEGMHFPSSNVLQLSIPSLRNPAPRQVTPGQSHSPKLLIFKLFMVYLVFHIKKQRGQGRSAG